MKEKITEVCEQARYTDILEDLIEELGGDKILSCNYESDYQGYVDIDVLLNDGRIFSYNYYYGSCSGCDCWEHAEHSNEKIIEIMKKEATFFDNIEYYNKWKLLVDKENIKS
ncbi:MAG: hypothetical protein GY714_18340 [Desulfobacterales bacterium]|nr:hypothetical protein [Desulfobacterales bacterium]